jgi:hypothetical protein
LDLAGEDRVHPLVIMREVCRRRAAGAGHVHGDRLLDARGGTGLHHADPVGEQDRFRDVVRDEEDRAGGALPDQAQLLLQHAARLRVHRREWLVHQQHGALADERAGDLDALLHATRQLAGELGLVSAQADHGQIFTRLGASARSGYALHAQAELDILDRGEPGIERIVALEDDDAIDAGTGDPALVDQDRARRRLLESGKQVERGRLAAPGGPQHQMELAVRDPQVEVGKHPRPVGASTEAEADTLETDHGTTIPCGGPSRNGRSDAFARKARPAI